MSEKFTACRVKETDHTGFNLLEGVAQCLLVNIERGNFAVRDSSGGAPMTQAATTRLRQPLPLGTAMLSHIALSLLLWNLTFRIVGWLLAA